MTDQNTTSQVLALLTFLSVYFADKVHVRMGKSKASITKISTAGLTGCYAFFITGEYRGSPFCWLEHQPYSEDPGTSSPPELLWKIMHHLAKGMKQELEERFTSSDINLRETSNLILLVAGGIQEFPDDTRNALALLQQPFHQELLGLFLAGSDAFHLVQHRQCRTTITATLGYVLSNKAEAIARAKTAAGLDDDQIIQPASVWIDFDCHTKMINLGFQWKTPEMSIDLATLDIDLPSPIKIYYPWVLQHGDIHNFKQPIVNNEEYIDLLDEAIEQVTAINGD